MSVAPATNQINFQAMATANDIKGGAAHFVPDAVDGLKGTKSEKAALGLNTDFTHFIKMLTTQLKNQDPTDPLDANQFTQQIVAFTGVEQAVATNNNLEKLIELNKGVQFSHASGLIGKEVEYDAASAELKQGSSAGFNYSLEPDSNQKIKGTRIKVLNSSGTIVRVIEGAASPGLHSISWDGLDYNKKKCPNDIYRISVDSFDEEGKPIKVGSSTMSGIVKEAEISAGSVFLNINGKKVPISQVKALKSKEVELDKLNDKKNEMRAEVQSEDAANDQQTKE